METQQQGQGGGKKRRRQASATNKEVPFLPHESRRCCQHRGWKAHRRQRAVRQQPTDCLAAGAAGERCGAIHLCLPPAHPALGPGPGSAEQKTGHTGAARMLTRQSCCAGACWGSQQCPRRCACWSTRPGRRRRERGGGECQQHMGRGSAAWGEAASHRPSNAHLEVHGQASVVLLDNQARGLRSCVGGGRERGAG